MVNPIAGTAVSETALTISVSTKLITPVSTCSASAGHARSRKVL